MEDVGCDPQKSQGAAGGPNMTEQQAREFLSGKLTFGDEKQIAAHKFLEQLELADESFQKCPNSTKPSNSNSPVWHWRYCGCLYEFSDHVGEALMNRYK